MDETQEDLSVDDVMSHVNALVEVCKSALDHQEDERTKASEYYNGEMHDVQAHPDMSSAASTDIRDTIKKLMPSIMRTLLANDRIAQFAANSHEQEDQADQATNYVNYVALKECDAEKAIYDAIYDAMVLKTGILKWCAYQGANIVIQKYTGQGDAALAELMNDGANEIMDLVSSPVDDIELMMADPNAQMHDFTLKRVEQSITPKLEAIHRERFLISPQAQTIEEAELVGERMIVTRSDLVGMGYDKEEVFSLGLWDELDDPDMVSRLGDNWTDQHSDSSKAMQLVEVYEVFVRLDMDNDGVAELHRIMYGNAGNEDGASGAENFVVLGAEMVSEAPYTEIVIERDPHQFEGHSITEDLKRVQQIKTVLLRGLLDNTYSQAEPRTAYVAGAMENPSDVGNPRKPLALVPGSRIEDVIQYRMEPFVGDKLLMVMQYADELTKDKSGITDASGGLTPEALQNTTATATALISEAGFAQSDYIIRSISHGLRKAFLGLLKLIIAHADRPRTIRVNGEFVEYDPRSWDAGMDCSINIGLGGGTRERDLASLQIVQNMQRELIQAFGNDNPFVKPEQIYNTIQKITETTGLPSADPYFTKPDPQQIAMKLQEAANQPNPEMEKLKAQMQLEQQKAEGRAQIERAQLEADVTTKQHEAAAKEESDVRQHLRELERLKSQTELKMAEIEANMIMKGITSPPPDIIPGGLPR